MMPYYKDSTNSVHFIESDVFANLLPPDCVEITQSEAEELTKPPPGIQDPRVVGIEFEGVMCSATRDDQNGLMAVLLASQLQGSAFKPTKFEFANGSTLVLSKENLPAFIATWMPFRQSFFLPK